MGSQLNPLDLLPAMEAVGEESAKLYSGCCLACKTSIHLASTDCDW